MHLLLDANVYLADPWQRGRKFKALVDFLGKTRSYVLVPEVVDQEVEATMERRWAEALDGLRSAHRDATRHGLEVGDQQGWDDLLARTREKWNQARKRREYPWRPIPTDVALLPVLLKRSIERIAPCAARGEEIRDALIWLGALKYCAEKKVSELGFVSSNVQDFGGEDGALHPTLQEDAKAHGVAVSFFASLDAFLKEHAEPIAWLTKEWVEQKIDQDELEDLLIGVFHNRDPEEFLQRARDDGWEAYSSAEIEELSFTLEALYVWEYDDESKTVFLTYAVCAEATVPVRRNAPSMVLTYDHGYYEERGRVRGESELIVELSARIENDRVALMRVEDVEKGW